MGSKQPSAEFFWDARQRISPPLCPFPSPHPFNLCTFVYSSSQMDGDSTQKPNSPIMCANGCGFFGYVPFLPSFLFVMISSFIALCSYTYLIGASPHSNPLTSNLCSKCHRDLQTRQKSAEPVRLTTPERMYTLPIPLICAISCCLLLISRSFILLRTYSSCSIYPICPCPRTYPLNTIPHTNLHTRYHIHRTNRAR